MKELFRKLSNAFRSSKEERLTHQYEKPKDVQPSVDQDVVEQTPWDKAGLTIDQWAKQPRKKRAEAAKKKGEEAVTVGLVTLEQSKIEVGKAAKPVMAKKPAKPEKAAPTPEQKAFRSIVLLMIEASKGRNINKREWRVEAPKMTKVINRLTTTNDQIKKMVENAQNLKRAELQVFAKELNRIAEVSKSGKSRKERKKARKEARIQLAGLLKKDVPYFARLASQTTRATAVAAAEDLLGE